MSLQDRETTCPTGRPPDIQRAGAEDERKRTAAAALRHGRGGRVDRKGGGRQASKVGAAVGANVGKVDRVRDDVIARLRGHCGAEVKRRNRARVIGWRDPPVNIFIFDGRQLYDVICIVREEIDTG